MEPLSFDPEDFGDEMARALRAIDPRMANVLLLHAQGLTSAEIADKLGVAPDVVRSRARSAATQIRRWRAGKRPSLHVGWCHVHRGDAEFGWWTCPASGVRRRYCATCRAERRAKRYARKSVCETCRSAQYLELKTHTKTGKTWLECRRCRAAYMREHMRQRRARQRALASSTPSLDHHSKESP